MRACSARASAGAPIRYIARAAPSAAALGALGPGGTAGRGPHAAPALSARFLPRARSKLDYAERHGYVKGVISEIQHDPGRGAPIMRVKFRDPYQNRKDEHVIVAPEGVYSGQFIYAGAKAELAVGNILPVGELPEGEQQRRV